MSPKSSRKSVVAALVVLSFAAPVFARSRLHGAQRSTPIALSPNGKSLVDCNTDEGSISLFKVTKRGLVHQARIFLGREPRSVAIAPDNRTAYVASAATNSVSVVNLKTRTVTKTLSPGAEPVALALSPNGTRLYVANSGSDDVSVFETKTGALLATVDVAVQGGAPRALAVTDDGDRNDADEQVLVACFFARNRPGKTLLDEAQDDQREGRVAVISAGTNEVVLDPVRLGPIADTGFNSNGQLAPVNGTTPAAAPANPPVFNRVTAAFPNQLASIAIRPRTHVAYVVSTGASPNGPAHFDSNAQGLVSLFDVTTRAELTAPQADATLRRTAPLNLNRGIDLATSPAPRLFLTNPVAIAWRPNGADAWIVAQQADVVVRMSVDAAGVPTIGAPLAAGPSSIVRVDLDDRSGRTTDAEVPRGIVIDAKGRRAYVANYGSRSVATIDISHATAPVLLGTVQSAALPASGSNEESLLRGAALFHTGRGPGGRMAREAWGSCAVCHPEGRSDGVTWMVESGPRQTISLDGTFATDDPTDQRALGWSGVKDEVHDFELYTRQLFGGRGLIDDDRVVFAIGGGSGAAPTDVAAVESFHRFTGNVSSRDENGVQIVDLTGFTPRRDFATATLPDGRVFILGGRSGAGPGLLVPSTDAVLEFDPRANTITRKNAAGFTLRHSFGAACIVTASGPRIYAIGGYPNTPMAFPPITTVEEYDPANDTWRTVAPLPTAVAQFGIAVAGAIDAAEPLQLIHVVGGNTAAEGLATTVNATPVQRYQPGPPGAGAWTTFSPFPVGILLRRSHGCATVVRNGSSRILVFGGKDNNGVTLPTMDEYAAQAGTYVAQTRTPLPVPLSSFATSCSPLEGRVEVYGGVDANNLAQASVIEFDAFANGAAGGPAGGPVGIWTVRSTLPTPRFGLQASAPPPVAPLVPVASAGRDSRLDAVKLFVSKARPARASSRLDAAKVLAGRSSFAQVGLAVPGVSCASCHSGPKWTRSRVQYTAPPSPEIGLGLGNQRIVGPELRLDNGVNVLVDVGTFPSFPQSGIRTDPGDETNLLAPLGANGFTIPSLLSVAETAPYLHDGSAATLTEVLSGIHDTAGAPRVHFVSDPLTRSNLVEFLRSIDDPTVPFPIQ